MVVKLIESKGLFEEKHGLIVLLLVVLIKASNL